MPTLSELLHFFPVYGNDESKRKLDNLKRLIQWDIFSTHYINTHASAALIKAALTSYRESLSTPERWDQYPNLAQIKSSDMRLNLVFSFLFDLACNAEYLHGRLTSSNWIYCSAHSTSEKPSHEAYFSFLKQCPACCLTKGLESRLAGAQHKPSSHHIGEITTTIITLLLSLVAKSNSKELHVRPISKQSHDVDAVAFRDDLLVLFEIKASPMLTCPVKADLAGAMLTDSENGPIPIKEHSLINIDFNQYPLNLYIPNADLSIPLGHATETNWPYPALNTWIHSSDNFLKIFSAWIEIYNAYSTPKTRRVGRSISLAYLANGWGDEIDSNKTKPGLGRTDDIKKGTYQLLKYGAYYRDGAGTLPVRSALVANLDPLFMYEEYISRLYDVRWAKQRHFERSEEDNSVLKIKEDNLFFLYEGILAFNDPRINDPLLRECFNFKRTDEALLQGNLDILMNSWEG
jgi:hypothetical protein